MSDTGLAVWFWSLRPGEWRQSLGLQSPAGFVDEEPVTPVVWFKTETTKTLMQTESITINVSKKAARAFRKAAPDLKQHIQEFLELWLAGNVELDQTMFEKTTEALERTVDEIGANARKRGLTDEILESILNEPKA